MSIAPRKPPLQLALRLKRALGGKAGWNGVAAQIAFAAILAWIAYEIVANARTNLETQHIASGFGFLKYNAGFDVNQSLIAYNNSDTYWRVFFVGLLNTILVSVIGIVFATVIGFIVALCRLSPNSLLSRIGGIYVEIVRNLPLLFQILFWYLAVLAALPAPRQSISSTSSTIVKFDATTTFSRVRERTAPSSWRSTRIFPEKRCGDASTSVGS